MRKVVICVIVTELAIQTSVLVFGGRHHYLIDTTDREPSSRRSSRAPVGFLVVGISPISEGSQSRVQGCIFLCCLMPVFVGRDKFARTAEIWHLIVPRLRRGTHIGTVISTHLNGDLWLYVVILGIA